MSALAARLALLAAMASSSLGLAAPPPATNPERVARIEELYREYRPSFQAVPEVDAAEVQRLVKEEGALLVDVRTPAEQAVSMLPGAIPAERFDAAAAAGKPVVAYCTIGARSGAWAATQRAVGVDARNFKGSVLAWSHVGGAFVDPAGRPTLAVHVYGATWDLLRTDHASVY